MTTVPGTDTPSQGAGGEGAARDQIRQARDKIVDQAKSTFNDARERAGTGLGQGRRQAADQLGGIGSALRRTGEQLRGEDQQRFADLADSASQRIERAANYLRDSDGRVIARDLETFARRQPALVFAGAFALGVLAARFLKSSEPESSYQSGKYQSYEPVRYAGSSYETGRYRGEGYESGSGGFDAPA